MHGAHNDFVVLDRSAATAIGGIDLVEFARWACDRRGGLGADGVIALESSNSADALMRTINADGSEAEICGNGIRCAARYVDETQARDEILFETIAGPISAQIVERGTEYAVRAAMGIPKIETLQLDGFGSAWFVDMGNPHVIVRCDDLFAVDLDNLGQLLQRERRFAGGTNVHVVVAKSDGSLHVRHWERGVGQTQACGTGAVASAAVAISQWHVASPVEVFVPGGRLRVEWDGEHEAFLTGPAVRVFDADIDVSFLR